MSWRDTSRSIEKDSSNVVGISLNRVDSAGSDNDGENHRYFSGNTNFENPQNVLKSRLSKVQMPSSKLMNKVPSKLLQQIFLDNREYLPVAMSNTPRRPSTIQKLSQSPRTSLTKQEGRSSKATDYNSPTRKSFTKLVSGQGTAMALATVKPFEKVEIDKNRGMKLMDEAGNNVNEYHQRHFQSVTAMQQHEQMARLAAHSKHQRNVPSLTGAPVNNSVFNLAKMSRNKNNPAASMGTMMNHHQLNGDYLRQGLGDVGYVKMKASLTNAGERTSFASGSDFDKIEMNGPQRDMIAKDRMQIQYQKFKIAQITQEKARLATSELDTYATVGATFPPKKAKKGSYNSVQYLQLPSAETNHGLNTGRSKTNLLSPSSLPSLTVVKHNSSSTPTNAATVDQPKPKTEQNSRFGSIQRKKLSQVVDSIGKMQLGLESSEVNIAHPTVTPTAPQRLAFQSHYKYDRDTRKYQLIDKTPSYQTQNNDRRKFKQLQHSQQNQITLSPKVTKKTSRLGISGQKIDRSPSPHSMHQDLLSKVKAKNQAIATQLGSSKLEQQQLSPTSQLSSKERGNYMKVAQSAQSLPAAFIHFGPNPAQLQSRSSQQLPSLTKNQQKTPLEMVFEHHKQTAYAGQSRVDQSKHRYRQVPIMEKPATKGGEFAPIDYVQRTRKDTTRMYGQANSMKDLLETIKQDKKVENKLIRRHGDHLNPSQVQVDAARTSDKKDDAPSENGENHSQSSGSFAKPHGSEKRHPHLYAHFLENMTLADKVRKHQQDSKIDAIPSKDSVVATGGDTSFKNAATSIVTSDYSIVSSKPDTGIQTPHSFLKTAKFDSVEQDEETPDVTVEEGTEMDQQWKKYIMKKKVQKEAKKHEKFFNSNLTDSERMRLLVPVNDLIINLKKDKRFGEKLQPPNLIKSRPKVEKKPKVYFKTHKRPADEATQEERHI